MKYGFFDDTAREYVITRPDTPAPWANNNSNYEQDQVNLQYSLFIGRTYFEKNRVV